MRGQMCLRTSILVVYMLTARKIPVNVTACTKFDGAQETTVLSNCKSRHSLSVRGLSSKERQAMRTRRTLGGEDAARIGEWLVWDRIT